MISLVVVMGGFSNTLTHLIYTFPAIVISGKQTIGYSEW